MIKVGLTGNLGSGKTTVAKIFEALGIPVFYADDVAKTIANTSAQVKDSLVSYFGAELYAGGVLNRELLSQKIFQDAEAIKMVNGIIHPAVAEAFSTWVVAQTSAYVVQEAAILFETGSYKRFDKMILVTAPTEVRIARVAKRNGWPRAEILQRMSNQWDENQKIPLADFVILNDGSKALIPQVMAIHENLIHTATARG